MMGENHMYKKLAMVVISIFLACAIAESFLRLNADHFTTRLSAPYDFPCYQTGTYMYQQLIPNATCVLHSNYGAFPDTTVVTNRIGLRDKEITLPKPIGTKRILFLGDSFTMGLGVNEEQSFPRVVEKDLRAYQDIPQVQTVNAGINGVGPFYDFVYLKHDGLKLDPDIVVVGFLPWKDIPWDIHELEYISKTDEQGLPDAVGSARLYVDSQGYIRDTKVPLRFRVPILRSFALFQLVARTLIPIRDAYQIGFTNSFCIFQINCHDVDDAKANTKKIFLQMQQLLLQHDKKLLVILIPAEFQVYDNTMPGKYFQNPSFGLKPTEKRRPHIEFDNFFEANGIEYLDLLPVFEEHPTAKPWFDSDTHWNALGHTIAADAIHKRILQILNQQ